MPTLRIPSDIGNGSGLQMSSYEEGGKRHVSVRGFGPKVDRVYLGACVYLRSESLFPTVFASLDAVFVGDVYHVHKEKTFEFVDFEGMGGVFRIIRHILTESIIIKTFCKQTEENSVEVTFCKHKDMVRELIVLFSAVRSYTVAS